MKKRIGILAVSLLVVCIVGICPALVKTIHEEVTVKPVKTISPAEESIISSAATKVLRHIAKARGAIHEKDMDQAGKDLKQAHKLINIIKTSLPTTKVNDHIWVAKKHLSYESSEEVLPDLVPIYASLDEIQSFVSVDETKAHLDDAKAALEADDKEKGAKSLELAGESLVYVEMDMPLSYTERKVAEALYLMAEDKLKKADQVLKEAEDGVQVISIASYGPMVLAQESLWQATKDYAKGRYEAAKRALADAKVFLKMAAKQADDKTKAALARLNGKIDELEKKMAESGSDFSKEIKGLWNKTKDVYHKTVEKFK